MYEYTGCTCDTTLKAPVRYKTQLKAAIKSERECTSVETLFAHLVQKIKIIHIWS